MSSTPPSPSLPDEDCSTQQVARHLGLSVRSVQMMVDRGELEAWRTTGGHRRIARASVERWVVARKDGAAQPGRQAATPHSTKVGASATHGQPRRRASDASGPVVLLIEDSRHFQNLISMMIKAQFPHVSLHVADDGISGLALAGQLQPDVLLIDLLLPGIDGASLLMSLRSHPAFKRSRLMVITSLNPDQLDAYATALGNVPVVHKPELVLEFPPLMHAALTALAPRRPA
ncbi:excisionase family DNA-binding protein [Ideonella sp.]|uniref:excisionase family DNA-binding protein n=1 Tax=Ideonella sp. TaxID=1929293 RepID=UPI003BB6C9F2